MMSRLMMLGAATLAAGTAMAAPRGFTVEDLVRMERVGSPAISPDGKQVVYTVRTTDMEKNRGNTQLWMLDLRNPKASPVRLTQLRRPSSAGARSGWNRRARTGSRLRRHGATIRDRCCWRWPA